MVKIGLSDYEIYDRGVKSPNGGGNRVPPVTICRQTLFPFITPPSRATKFGNTVLPVEFLALSRSKGGERISFDDWKDSVGSKSIPN